MPLIFSAIVASTLRAASLNAAATRSSSISRSSPTSEGSMLTRFTSYLHVICTLTRPALEVEGQSGAGLVTVQITCKYEGKRVSIAASLVGADREMLAD